MLNHLDIENIAVIEKAAIDFEAGLNVLTGETGAGKSIIIDAINAVRSRFRAGACRVFSRAALRAGIFAVAGNGSARGQPHFAAPHSG